MRINHNNTTMARITAAAIAAGLLSIASSAIVTAASRPTEKSAPVDPAIVWTGDAKDHPRYGPVDPAIVWTGDAKDHPRYGPVVWTGDAKDHPRYGPVASAV